MKKNVIIILVDGARLDYALKSNYFNKLKTKSSFFSQTITYGPHTIAAMHAVFSGSFGSRTGVNSYWSTYKFKKNRFKTLTEYLKENNYFTCADIVSELVLPKQGFDEFLTYDEHKDDLTIRHKKLIQKMNNKFNSKQNFLLFLHYTKIHTTISDEVLKIYNNFSEEYFDNRKQNEERYDKLFQNAEEYLLSIMSEIENLHLNKNSIILIMSDHGTSVGEKLGERAYGAFCYDYTLKTFAYFIAEDLPTIEIKKQVRGVDFMPTILEYLGINHDEKFELLDGESLLPAINGEISPEKIAYSETGNPMRDKAPPKEPNIRAIRTSKWKLIFNEYNDSRELYDLENDPNEEVNLSGKNLEIESILSKKLIQLKNGELVNY